MTSDQQQNLTRAPQFEMVLRIAVEQDAADRTIRFVEELREAGIQVETSGPLSGLVLSHLAEMREALERRLAREPDNEEAIELLDRVGQAEALQRFIQKFAEPHS